MPDTNFVNSQRKRIIFPQGLIDPNRKKNDKNIHTENNYIFIEGSYNQDGI